MRFRRAELACGRAGETAAFYGEVLGLPVDRGEVLVGETALVFAAGDGDPFYHLALLVPGDRFDAGLAWARAQVELLPNRDSGDVVFDFPAWRAHACYFLDPAGNIVELIAHAGVEEHGATGEFAAEELAGLSELGLVGDRAAIARELEGALGIRVWSGTVAEPGSLAFAGERARTLILAPVGRGWLPTGRAAEAHRADVLLDAGRYSYLTPTR